MSRRDEQWIADILEAANHVSAEQQARLPDVPWRPIVGFRNILAHAYFQIDWDTVWIAATERAPELVRKLGGSP